MKLGISALARLTRASLILATLAGCGTYRTGSGQYRGVGDYRPPSDYAEGAEAPGQVTEADQIGARGKLSPRAQYIPHGVFKLYWPVAQVRVNRGFHPPEDPAHSGLDLGGKRGTAILAAHEGVVIYAGQDFSGYGKMIMVEYDGEWATLYGHLDEFGAKENTIVAPGDQIGTMGSTGRASGVHLHFEVMHNHQAMDPMTLLTKPSNYVSVKAKKRRSSKSGRRKNAL